MPTRSILFSLLLSIGPAWAQLEPPRPWIGVGIVDVSPERAEQLGLPNASGVEIALVEDGTPAHSAGLQHGDVVTVFRGEPVVGVEHFARLVRETPIGREIRMEVWNQQGARQVDLVVGRRAVSRVFKKGFPVEAFDFDIPRATMVVRNRTLGVEMEQLKGQLAKFFRVDEGVLIRSVEPGSPAAVVGLEAGDVITRAGDDPISQPSELRRSLSAADGSAISLQVVRQGKTRIIQIETQRTHSFGRPFRSRSVSAAK